MSDDFDKKKESKKINKLDKLFLGVIIGGAVGSVVGATISKKENMDKIKKKMMETSASVKAVIKNQQKNSIWHTLNKVFFRKK